MQTVDQQTVKKQLNAIGILFDKAPESKQLAFKASLSAFSERDKTDYYRAFREVWKYAPIITKAPFPIVATAHNVLGYNPY